MRRTLDEVRRDQEALLDAYRAERTVVRIPETRPTAGSAGNDFAYGRVVEVITSDETYGPHLLVMRQSWSGIPPVAADCGVGPLRCYSLPGGAVDDFAVNELIRVNFVIGAILAERLA